MYDAPWARGIVGKQVSVEGMDQQTRNGRSASAAEVAALAGVSRQTVSRVVNGMPNVTEKTRKRVLAAMEELGFRPNFAGAALRGGSYRSIGLCMYNITRVGNLATLEGIMQAAREHDFAVTMIEMGGDKPYALADASRRMVERPVDGMILNMNRMAPDFEEFVSPAGSANGHPVHVCASALHDDRLRPVWFVRAVDQLSAGTWSLEYAVCGGSGKLDFLAFS